MWRVQNCPKTIKQQVIEPNKFKVYSKLFLQFCISAHSIEGPQHLYIKYISNYFCVFLHLSSLPVVEGPQHLLHGGGSTHDWLLTDGAFGHLLLARTTLQVPIGAVEDLGRGWH